MKVSTSFASTACPLGSLRRQTDVESLEIAQTSNASIVTEAPLLAPLAVPRALVAVEPGARLRTDDTTTGGCKPKLMA